LYKKSKKLAYRLPVKCMSVNLLLSLPNAIDWSCSTNITSSHFTHFPYNTDKLAHASSQQISWIQMASGLHRQQIRPILK